MKTDSLFYSLFQSNPSVFFELIGQPTSEAQGYRFESIEVKQTAFRLDGVFLPPANQSDAPVYFVEIQFQRDAMLYRRLFSEVFLYLRQRPAVKQWRAVVVYPSVAMEIREAEMFDELLDTSYMRVVYLDQLGAISDLSLELGILRLIVEPEASVPVVAKSLIDRVQQSRTADVDTVRLVELIETIVVYIFPRRSRQEIAAMLGLVDLKETRVYQETREEALKEGREEGREEEAKALVSRLLVRKVGNLTTDLQEQVNQLPLETLEVLGEALFDFNDIADLRTWLEQQA
ncbi:Rpn family recombination-promoting nuclease/putative transposase [Oscillatoria sp. CS-180]|uniref:Rpn family recombination-promoting nuclease/putative transposase n=1 Tax=Oscillatoria sp. CS-180 TaxID=3021720 RepID=UPI00232F355A|nr:Rpn family recombination-promoting nuclease/putative transposase [Oscillatoria sp. CS-180]MDB9526201.1 Rpn family recombination-promoting nuclease/putative transposase [Oscillatoria sp. CS-180]